MGFTNTSLGAKTARRNPPDPSGGNPRDRKPAQPRRSRSARIESTATRRERSTHWKSSHERLPGFLQPIFPNIWLFREKTIPDVEVADPEIQLHRRARPAGIGARVALGFAGACAGYATHGFIEHHAVRETCSDKCPGRGGDRTRGESELDRVESPWVSARMLVVGGEGRSGHASVGGLSTRRNSNQPGTCQ